MKRMYLDNAAATPIDSDVIKTMKPFLEVFFGNPSSIYIFCSNENGRCPVKRSPIVQDFIKRTLSSSIADFALFSGEPFS